MWRMKVRVCLADSLSFLYWIIFSSNEIKSYSLEGTLKMFASFEA